MGKKKSELIERGSNMKVNILGQEYKIKLEKNETEKLKGKDGYTELYAKKIVIRDNFYTSHPGFIKQSGKLKKAILKHEIVHAFFHESGIALTYGDDEALVDWIGMQLEKMYDAFKEAEKIYNSK